MKKKIIAALLACALAVMGLAALAGCSSNSSSSNNDSVAKQEAETPKEPQTIKIGCPDENGMLTDNGRIAQALGYLDEELQAAGYVPEYVSFGWGGVRTASACRRPPTSTRRPISRASA